MSAGGASPAQAAKKAQEPLSAFEFMNKYRVPILVICVVGLFGFGVWGFIVDYFHLRGGEDPSKVIATWSWSGETHEVTLEQYYSAFDRSTDSSDREKEASDVFARIIRTKLMENAGVVVSDKEFTEAFKESVRDPIERSNPAGKFDPAAYRQRIWYQYRLTPAEYEVAFRGGLATAKFMQDIDRLFDDTTTADIFEEYKKYYSKVKLKGIFFDDQYFKDAAKLATEKVGDTDELTKESRDKLSEWWKGLTEQERKAYHKGGAVLTVEGIGMRFKGKSDEELQAEFTKESLLSKTSLEKLTAEDTPTDDDLAKLKLRLGMFRDAYGVAPDADIEATFEAKKARLVTEWKIWKLSKRVHTQMLADIAASKPVDFAAVAEANNLQHFKWTNMKLEGIIKHEEFPGFYANQLPGLEPNAVLNWLVATGPQAPAFEGGPVDEFGKHVSIFRLVEKNLNPEPNLSDVLKDAAAGYEKSQATKLRDEAFDLFKKRMDDVMSAKAKEFIDKVNTETADAIKKDTEGLNAETDKAKIDEITKAKNAEAEARIADEKSKYRSEAFDAAIAEAIPGSIVVEEGFFKADSAATETPADREKATFEQKARSSLRREFAALKDSIYTSTTVAVGTVSEPIDSPFYAGMKGIAKLIEKKEPTVADMFYSPQEMAAVENQIRQKKNPAGDQDDASIWDLAHLKRVFNLESKWTDDLIEKEKESKRKAQQKAEEFNQQQAARNNAMPLTPPNQVPPAIPPR